MQIGSHLEYDDLLSFAQTCDVVTFDHEHVASEHIRQLVEAGHEVHPGADALVFAQDKLLMRERLSSLSIPVPRWSRVSTVAAVESFADGQWPVILKAAKGGYDGKGVWVIDSASAAESIVVQCAADGMELLAEEKVQLTRELAVLVARSKFGQVSTWPVVETVQKDGICVEVIAPAPGLSDALAERATTLGIEIAARLGVTGVLAVELFETFDDSGEPTISVNELAMRPHNSGHWTIDGSTTSQFEQHLRAVLDYPLGRTTMRTPYAVMANVFGGEDGGLGIDERVHHLMAKWPEVKIHLYGKEVRPGRKIGHVTACGEDLEPLRSNTSGAAAYLTNGIFE